MSKTIRAFFATIFTVVAMQSHALQATLLPAIPDSISWDRVLGLQTNITGYSGGVTHQFLWRVAGDTLHSTSLVGYPSSPIKRALLGLPADTTIEVFSVVIDAGIADTSTMISFNTKPLPHAAWFSNLSYVSTPSQTLGIFSYNVSVPTYVFVNYSAYLEYSNTVVVNGTGTDTVYMTNPNVPGTSYNNNVIWGNPVNSFGGLVGDTFVSFPNYTVPQWLGPDVSSITFSNVVQDSFHFTVNVVLGNAVSSTVVIKDLDSNGAVVATRPSFIVYNDGPITETRIGLPYVLYGQRFIVTTTGGTDSVQDFQRTAQIPGPQVTSSDTITATTTSTNIQVDINPQGLWSTSTTAVWIKWTDEDGTVSNTATQSIAPATTPSTLTFGPLTNLKQNPQWNTLMVYAQNIAGLLDSLEVNFQLRPLAPAVPIDAGWYVDAANPWTVRVMHVNAGPSTGTYSLWAFRNVVGSGQVDTILLRINQNGYTNFQQIDSIFNCIGNTTYEIRLATKNQDGVWFITGSQSIQTMPAANPTFFISNAYTVTSTDITFRVMGCANGTAAYLDIDLYEADFPLNSLLNYSIGYIGTGNFSIIDGITGLFPCTNYIIRATVHDAGNTFNQGYDLSFWTNCTTGIQEISQTFDQNQHVTATDIRGSEIAQGPFSEVWKTIRHDHRGQMVILTGENSDGTRCVKKFTIM